LLIALLVLLYAFFLLLYNKFFLLYAFFLLLINKKALFVYQALIINASFKERLNTGAR
jgi:hypothetical protein